MDDFDIIVSVELDGAGKEKEGGGGLVEVWLTGAWWKGGEDEQYAGRFSGTY